MFSINEDKPSRQGADFSCFVLHDPDEFDGLTEKQTSTDIEVINGVEEYKDIINAIMSFWGNEKYMREYYDTMKLNKQDLSVVRFPPKMIEDLKFLQDFHTRVHGGGYQHQLSLEQKTSIKDFPHIYQGLLLHWGKPKDFHEFLELKKLTVQDRDRGGFAPQVLKELQALIDEHNKKFGLPEKKKHDFEVHQDNWTIGHKVR